MQIDHLDSKGECQREGCNCSVPVGEEFCSERCRKAARDASPRDEDRVACACGHDECAGDR